jgi:hypothetical protein
MVIFMNNNAQNKGTITQSGGVIRFENALVEEAFAEAGGTGYIVVSYGVHAKNNMINAERMRLNISRRTRIADRFGVTVNPREIRKGMRVNAATSSAVTKSIPPQSPAYEIVVLSDASPMRVTTGRVVKTDVPNGYLITGSANDNNSRIRFNISRATVITDRSCSRIGLGDIKPGQTVRVEHANLQTMSIPPQTTAFRITVIS